MGEYNIQAYNDMIKPDMSEPFEDKELCSKCKNSCCDRAPCELVPEDIKEPITYDTIRKLISTGFIVIDRWDGDFTVNGETYSYLMFLRIRGKLDCEEDIVNFNIPCSCVLLTSTGCILDWQHRPYTGRYCMPCKDTNRYEQCYDVFENSKMYSAYKWREYQDILSNIVDEEDNINTDISFLDTLDILNALLHPDSYR